MVSELIIEFSPVLSRNEIVSLLGRRPPLVECFVSREDQVQPNGVDLTVRDVASLSSAGVIACSNAQRTLSTVSGLEFGAGGFLDLAQGCYLITYNEIVHIPRDMMALGRPRSSLLRCGATIGTAVWDAGYEGRSQSLLTVQNPAGLRLEKNARVMQLIFLRLSGPDRGYEGVFQRENL